MRLKNRYIILLLPAIVSGLLFGGAFFGYIMPQTKETVMDRRRELIRDLTNTAYSVIASYAAQAKSGNISADVAKQRALVQLSNMRYGHENRDYFWVNDLNAVMIMHPYRLDLIGQDLMNYRDSNGKRMFAEMVELAKSKGAGFISYTWQRYNLSDKAVPKLSYIRLYEPWGWVVGTGIYIADYEADIATLTRDTIFLGILSWLVVAVLSVYIALRRASFDEKQQKVEKALRDSERLQKEIIDFLPDATWVVDKQGKIMAWNRAMESLTGIDSNDMIGKGNYKHSVPFFGKRKPMLIDYVIKPNPIRETEFSLFEVEGNKYHAEMEVEDLDGSARYLAGTAGPLFNANGKMVGAIQSIRDVSGRKALEDELTRLATTDSLTGVNNRHHFWSLAREELARSKRYSRPMAMLMLDLDHFKNINDSFGHHVGDQVLVGFTQACLKAIRETDCFGRLGGEEFGALLVETDLEDARQVAWRIRERVEEMRLEAEGQEISITVSVGLTILKSDDDSVKMIMQRADQALYAAKNAGRNRVMEL
jgi:diguanylate cyclase (GGDEF)-like protein